MLIAFPLQQWLQESGSVLRCKYFSSLGDWPQSLPIWQYPALNCRVAVALTSNATDYGFVQARVDVMPISETCWF